MTNYLRKYLIAVFLFIASYSAKAQVYANFSVSSPTTCVLQPLQFTDGSTTSVGSIVGWQWNFGNGSTSTAMNPVQGYSAPGVYTVTLVVTNSFGNAATIIRSIMVFPNPVADFSFTADRCYEFTLVNFTDASTSANGSIVSWYWMMGDGSQTTTANPNLVHLYVTPGTYSVKLFVTDNNGCVDSVTKTVANPPKNIIPAAGALALFATDECIDIDGWTNYSNNNNTPTDTNDDILLLSLKKNGNVIGTIGDGTFQVKAAATSGAGSNTGILLTNPLITNPTGFWVMNRYWQVIPTTQPTSDIDVRFYFNSQDLADVNGSYPTQNLNYTDLLFYKIIGGDPDPTTNLSGATRIISIVNGTQPDTTTWTYYDMLYHNRHYAEFKVGSFSGGGGGATGNLQVLPIQLLSFEGSVAGTDVVLKWEVGAGTTAEKYQIQKSLNGTEFFTVGSAEAGHSSFVWTDKTAFKQGVKVFYRLKITGRSGEGIYSKTIHFSSNNRELISVRPNPATSFIVINSQAPLASNSTVLMFDAMGRTVMSKPLFTGINEVVNLPALHDGYYRIVVMSDGKKVEVKNIIIRQ